MNRLSLLVDLATLFTREVDLDTLLTVACERMTAALDAERATLWLVDAERGDLFTKVALLPEVEELRLPIDRGITGHVVQTGRALRIDDAQGDPRFDPSADRKTGFITRSVLAVPIRDLADGVTLGAVQVLNRRGGVFDDDDERYLIALSAQLAQGLSLTTLKRSALGGGVVRRGQFNHVIGRSAAMQGVYERMSLAAPTDATVLLRGETGTGKTLLARTIHANSKRQGGPFVTVDCTTLPSQLVESELFGHERGAFTGADRRVLGKVELAQHGTLFLDEIGELPLEAQSKLLRLLQERTFERVGGRETHTADVRIVSATHKRLEQEVRAGRFREDLFYRIRVVEIDVPPLRARGRDEIEQLLSHFAEHFAARYDRPLPQLTERARTAALQHDWPGNVRELEHWVESRIVLSRNGLIDQADSTEPAQLAGPSTPSVSIPLGLTLNDASVHYVRASVQALEGNRSRAAESLAVGRNTVTRMLADERRKKT